MYTATLSSKFQISIPKTVRDAQNWKAGQEFVFILKEHGVLVMPVPTSDDLFGSVAYTNTEQYRDRDDRF
jgi:AbrB family looped-hinge helix DNA binding protein